SSFPFQPWQLSDGTIRFICLAAALLQPSPPATVVIDEPELGLHPFALDVLAGLFRDASERTQLVVSTQSAGLLNHFEPDDVIVVDRELGASRFRRLDASSLAAWLEDFSLGELWQKNVFDGGPSHE
ncbi:MAG: AAA family ATPase, partial [Desulfobacterales bacterium]